MAQQAATDAGVSYLQASQSAEGYWGAAAEVPYNALLDTCTALRALARVSPVSSAADAATAWLQTQAIRNQEYLAHLVICLRDAGQDVSTYAGQLAPAQNADGGWSVGGSWASDIRRTALAFEALGGGGAVDLSRLSSAVSYLLAAQRPDGGWGISPGDPTDVVSTAATLAALQTRPQTFSLTQASTQATTFLLSHQNADGGFGSSPSTVWETAMGLRALLPTAAPIAAKQGAVNYLLAQQQPDGSWVHDPYATALAIQVLAEVRPNLVVSAADVSFSPLTPQDGQGVIVATTIRNTGLQDATDVVVRFFLGDPNAGGVQVSGDQVVALVPSGGSAPVSISHAFSGTGGRTIFVQVDPINTIAETSETDNLASSRLWVATPPDLAVFTADLVPSTFTPEPGVAFALEYTLRNLGEASTGPVTVAVYDGTPGAGGVLLTTQELSGVSGAGSRTSTVGITLTSAVAHMLYIVADSTNQVPEQSETNNQASVTVQVGATPMAADLAVTPMDITLNPTRPQTGEAVQITARFRNEGTEAASNVIVELFDGAPESGGALLASATRTLAPGEEQTLTATWTATAGLHDLYVVLDRTNQLVEIKETNNQAVLRVMPDLVDLMVSATDLAFTPAHPVIGDSVTLTATVRNLGIRQTGAFAVALYDGDPAAGGTLLHTVQVPNLLGDASMTVTYPFTAEARTYRFYVVADTDGQVTELDETNNQSMRSLRIKAPGEILGPDLTPLKIDVDNATTDGQTLAISGSVRVTVQNQGDAKITTPSAVLIFDDADFDGRYTAGVDTVLGTADATQTLWPEGATLVTVPLTGAVRFLDAPLHVQVDAHDALAETDETNNHRRSGADCEVRPAQPIQPVVEWRWRGAVGADFNSTGITMPPAIVNLTDDNGDGRIDGDDVPDLAFIASTDAQGRGMVRALRGDTGAQLFGVRDPAHAPSHIASLAAGDLDGDGRVELVTPRAGAPGLLVFEHDGTLKWDNAAQVATWNQSHLFQQVTMNQGGTPLLADLDADGIPEIVMGGSLINADGSIRCGRDSRSGGGLGATGAWYAPNLVDLDGDGRQEIMAGNTAYRSDCTILWQNTSLPDGYPAIGNFDDDPAPEVVVVTYATVMGQPPGGKVYLLEHDGTMRWGPIALRGLEPTAQTGGLGGPPVVADFNGDGRPDIGVSGHDRYFALDADGRVVVSYSTPYNQGFGDGFYSAPTVFDLNGDGQPEVLINKNGYFRIFDGPSGTLRYEERFGAGFNSYQNVVIADVDGDHQAEAVVFGFGWFFSGDGLRVYGAAGNDWVPARRIHHQPDYHITNINDDGTIPQHEAPSWLVHNSYRVQAPIGNPANPYLVANLTASALRAVQTGAGLALTVRVGNGGAIAAPSGAPVAWYDGDPTAGGVLIGTGQTTRALAPGDYQDVVFTWPGASAGSRTVVAIVDPDATRPDCDPTDNRASLVATIVPILPDLAVSGADMVVIGPLTEGRLIPVRVTVHNAGGADAASAAVRLTLGAPTQGGVELGRVTLPALAAGASAAVDLVWDSLNATGTNYLYAQVDPDGVVSEATTTNNVALIPVDLTAPPQPDLVLAGVTVSSSPVREGHAFTVTTTVRNRGADVGGVVLALYLGDPAAGGVSLGTQTLPTILAHGQTATLTWTVGTLGRAGSHTLVALVDPNAVIPELEETNNRGAATVTILSSGLAVVVSTNHASYSANEAVGIVVTLYNSGPGRTVDLDVLIEDASGVLVQTAATRPGLALADGETRSITDLAFNTGVTFAGDYRVRVRAREGSTVSAQGIALFVIRPVIQAEARLVADKQAYSSHETVTLTTAVTSQSPNHVLTGVTASITITDPAAATVFNEVRSLLDLLPGGRIELKSFWDTGVQIAGLYTASITVQGAGGLAASSQTAFEILSSADQAAALAGSIAVEPRTILETEHATMRYTIQNIGNEIDLPLIQVEVLVVDPDTEAAVRTLTGEASLNGREVHETTIAFDSVGLLPKPYLIVLRGTTAGVPQALGSAGLTIQPSPNTAPIADAGPDQVGFVGQVITLDGTGSSDPNDDPLTFAWRFIAVPAGSQLTAAALVGATTPTPSFVPDADGTYEVGLIVHDGTAPSPEDRVVVFIAPPLDVDVHPETINLKSQGGATSITVELEAGVRSAFASLTAPDGITVTASFELVVQYVDAAGQTVIFTIPNQDYPGNDRVEADDEDDSGHAEEYEITLKFARSAFIAGFKDAQGQLRITNPTTVTSTVIGNGLVVGHDTIRVLPPTHHH